MKLELAAIKFLFHYVKLILNFDCPSVYITSFVFPNYYYIQYILFLFSNLFYKVHIYINTIVYQVKSSFLLIFPMSTQKRLLSKIQS